MKAYRVVFEAVTSMECTLLAEGLEAALDQVEIALEEGPSFEEFHVSHHGIPMVIGVSHLSEIRNAEETS